MTSNPPFHLAFRVNDLAETRLFYTQILGCTEGRSSDLWIDFNFYGHQIVAHLSPQTNAEAPVNPVDGKSVPVPHFGVVLSMAQWQILANKLTEQNVDFIIAPYIRFKDEAGEQATMFFKDPSNNAIEIKAFADMAQLFAK